MQKFKPVFHMGQRAFMVDGNKIEKFKLTFARHVITNDDYSYSEYGYYVNKAMIAYQEEPTIFVSKEEALSFLKSRLLTDVTTETYTAPTREPVREVQTEHKLGDVVYWVSDKVEKFTISGVQITERLTKKGKYKTEERYTSQEGRMGMHSSTLFVTADMAADSCVKY